MEVETKEDGAQILYDEPPHHLDPRNEKTWPPRLVVLSSLWAFKVVTEDSVPHSVRYAFWPTTGC